MTAHATAANMPVLIDHSSSDKDDYFTHQYESDVDSIDGDDLDNRKMSAQLPRNENENWVKIGSGGGNLNGDNGNCSFFTQDTIEDNL
eukprot:1227558-Ditylum_brightwellii.AAC.1